MTHDTRGLFVGMFALLVMMGAVAGMSLGMLSGVKPCKPKHNQTYTMKTIRKLKELEKERRCYIEKVIRR